LTRPFRSTGLLHFSRVEH